jgi:hypothetical protein
MRAYVSRSKSINAEIEQINAKLAVVRERDAAIARVAELERQLASERGRCADLCMRLRVLLGDADSPESEQPHPEPAW